MHYHAPDIVKLGTILGIWAHPDDETWSMAGIMATACGNNQRVVCVTATHGDAGKTADETRWPKRCLKDIRTEETEAALKAVGCTEHYWLDYPDGMLAEADEVEGIAKLASLCVSIKPDTIMTFEPNGITGHDDHRTISKWTVAAALRAVPGVPVFGAIELREKYETFGKKFDQDFDIYFNTDKPALVSKSDADIYFELPDSVLEAKLTALHAHASQTEQMFARDDTKAYLKNIAESEHFIRLA